MVKILINTRPGMFCLSHQAVLRYAELKGFSVYPERVDAGQEIYIHWLDPVGTVNPLRKGTLSFNESVIDRHDPELIQIFEELGDRANGYRAALQIIRIPADVDYQIESEEDGSEYVAEKHHTWRLE